MFSNERRVSFIDFLKDVSRSRDWLDRFLIKAAFGSEALKSWRPDAYLRADAYKRKRSKVEDDQCS